MQTIYLDHNATTPMLPEVWQAMAEFDGLGNPASAHRAGRKARQALEAAREKIAGLLDAHADEVVFTSGGTEANNLALAGLAPDEAHILISPIEHPSVVEPGKLHARRGGMVEELRVDGSGRIDVEAVAAQVRAETRLVAVMLANHETGVVQPIGAFARRLPAGVALHCDAVQAVGKLPVRFHELGVTTLSASGHKFNGPPGVGLLLVRRGAKLTPLTHGGHQQQGRRPGSEPVGLIVGLAAALEIACREQADRSAHVGRLRQLLIDELSAHAGPIVVNGPEDASPYTLNVSFPGCGADALLMNLDLAGVCCSTGSACSSGSLLPSPVLVAMGVPEDVLRSAQRFSFSHLLSEDEVREAARRIVAVVGRLRGVHP